MQLLVMLLPEIVLKVKIIVAGFFYFIYEEGMRG